MSKDQVERLVKEFYKWVICVEQYMKKVVSLEDCSLTAKFFITLFTINTISSWFCESFLIWASTNIYNIAINILFAWIPVYSNYKDLIDNTIESGKKTISENYEIVKSMIPKYEEKKNN